MSSPNPNDYDPISTLEKQYISPPLGRRLTLLLKLSPTCVHIPGGIETILKSSRANNRRTQSSSSHPDHTSSQRGTISGGFDMGGHQDDANAFQEPAVEATIECDMGDITLREINVSGGEDDSTIDSRRSGNRSRTSSAGGGGGGGGRSSPFGFLYDSQKEEGGMGSNAGISGRDHSNSHSDRSMNTASSSVVRKMGGGFSNFKSNLKKGWDRQVTSIVLQAQKVAPSGTGSGTRDLLTVGAYVRDGRTMEYDTCLGMTERAEIPVEGDQDAEDGLTFRIPIVVPPHLLEQMGEDMATGIAALIQFQIYIRSGAAIFTKSRGLRSYYPVGFTSLYADSLNKKHPSVMQLPIQSDVVKNGTMTLTVLGDMKFPGLCKNGWSLTDPQTETAYNDFNGKKMFFNAPLDQSYIFPVPSSSLPPPLHNTNPSQLPTPTNTKPISCIVATERSSESTVILPLALAFSRLLSTASQKSLQHSLTISNQLQYLHNAVSVKDPNNALQSNHAQCNIDLLYLLRSTNDAPGAPGMGGGRVSISIHLQRPDSIFENCLLAGGTVPTYTHSTDLPTFPAVRVPFFPRVVGKGDPRLLPGLDKGESAGYRCLLGKLRMELYEEGIASAGADVFSPIGPTSGVGIAPKSYDILVDIEQYMDRKGGGVDGIERAPVVDSTTGQSVGFLVFRLSVRTKEGMMEEQPLLNFRNGAAGGRTSRTEDAGHGGASFIEGGLISLMGMDTLMIDDKACHPYSDVQTDSLDTTIHKPPPNATQEAMSSHRRRRQVATMGEFLTFAYMGHHTGVNRATNAKIFLNRADEYQRSLHSQGSDIPASLSPDERRDPRPFRPSSSRLDPLLCGIGFNIHVHNMCLLSVTIDEDGNTARTAPSALFQNVTCGAPSDHLQGFSGGHNDQKRISGGLRRLETERVTAAQRVRETQDNLIAAVALYYNEMARSGNKLAAASMRHVPSCNVKIMRRRKLCIEATQILHELTWNIAVRRGNVFSQALGIGLTLYLAHVSDAAKLSEGVWADVWKHHGFLIVFEGLLSAAGKELGMIEDASVGIAMLRMVEVVLRPEDWVGDGAGRVPVPESPYIVWLNIIPSGSGPKTRFLVEVGVDIGFYNQRVPVPLQDGTPVRFYPLLYQMGVDIRQWGANAGANMSRRRTPANAASGSEDENEDDEFSHANHDVLKSLNYEAFRKMNGYAHSVNPCDTSPAERAPSWEQAHDSQQQVLLAIHPSLAPLFEYIRSSAGKMEHGILDEAATAAARLGGGSAIFCKSGKDRTAMQVTYKQAQFVSRVMKNKGNGFGSVMDKEQVLKDATTMRVYGTRLPICEKNVGQALFAFNSLQSRFMPDMLKPPPRTLAGFLKGGRVFSKGGIES